MKIASSDFILLYHPKGHLEVVQGIMWNRFYYTTPKGIIVEITNSKDDCFELIRQIFHAIYVEKHFQTVEEYVTKRVEDIHAN